MKIVDRYLLLIFARFFLMVLAALVVLYALIDFLENVDDLIEDGAAAMHYLLLPIYNLPLILSNTLPMAILLGAFATIGSLSRTSQLTALSGSGFSFGQLSRPLFFCALLLSGLVFLNNAWLMPYANRQATYLTETELNGDNPYLRQRHDLYLRSNHLILDIGSVFAAQQQIADLTLFAFATDDSLQRRTEAERGFYQGDGRWSLENVQIWTFAASDGQVASYRRLPSLVMDLDKSPEELVDQWQNPEDMALPALLERADVLAAEGRDNRSLRIESQVRMAKSATPLIMILLAIPFALQRGRQASFALGFIASLGVFLTYFVLEAIFTAFAHAAILPPWVAAWAANALLGLTGLWLFLRMDA